MGNFYAECLKMSAVRHMICVIPARKIWAKQSETSLHGYYSIFFSKVHTFIDDIVSNLKKCVKTCCGAFRVGKCIHPQPHSLRSRFMLRCPHLPRVPHARACVTPLSSLLINYDVLFFSFIYFSFIYFTLWHFRRKNPGFFRKNPLLRWKSWHNVTIPSGDGRFLCVVCHVMAGFGVAPVSVYGMVFVGCVRWWRICIHYVCQIAAVFLCCGVGLWRVIMI